MKPQSRARNFVVRLDHPNSEKTDVEHSLLTPAEVTTVKPVKHNFPNAQSQTLLTAEYTHFSCFAHGPWHSLRTERKRGAPEGNTNNRGKPLKVPRGTKTIPSDSAGAPQPSELASNSDPRASPSAHQPIEQTFDSIASVPASAAQPGEASGIAAADANQDGLEDDLLDCLEVDIFDEDHGPGIDVFTGDGDSEEDFDDIVHGSVPETLTQAAVDELLVQNKAPRRPQRRHINFLLPKFFLKSWFTRLGF